jgi:hypothetical protein
MRRASALGNAMVVLFFWMDGSQRFEITYVKPKLQHPKSNLDDKYVLRYSDLPPNSIIGTWNNP